MEFQDFFAESGIMHETSCAYTPHQNGAAERTIGIIQENMRALKQNLWSRNQKQWWIWCTIKGISQQIQVPDEDLWSRENLNRDKSLMKIYDQWKISTDTKSLMKIYDQGKISTDTSHWWKSMIKGKSQQIQVPDENLWSRENLNRYKSLMKIYDQGKISKDLHPWWKSCRKRVHSI